MNTNQVSRYETITADNIDAESFYNASALCRLTGYANAPAAIRALDLAVEVRKDDCGNIRQVIKIS